MTGNTTDEAAWPVIDRIAAWVGVWALRRLYGECATDVREDFPEDPDVVCIACDATRLIKSMEEIARG
jgi:hypothetical protein